MESPVYASLAVPVGMDARSNRPHHRRCDVGTHPFEGRLLPKWKGMLKAKIVLIRVEMLPRIPTPEPLKK